jgi:hypothetical protein
MYSWLFSTINSAMASVNPFSRLFNYYGFHLANLEPSASQDDPIRVSLSTQNRTDTPYEVISYDRSRDYGSSKIFLDDVEIEIPKPLETALRALRKTDTTRLLWADLLLGRSLQEQNAQAAVAKTILENAGSTIAWLGPGSERTREAFKNIMTLANWWHNAKVIIELPTSLTTSTIAQAEGMAMEVMKRNVAELRPSDRALWDAMTEIFTAGYFDSVQSIPDIILSKNTIITSGTGSIVWLDFYPAYMALVVVRARSLNMATSPALLDGLQRVAGIEIAERRYRNDPGLELLPMIQTSRTMRTADNREYIFSMLPITRPSKRATKERRKEIPLAADYTKTEREVFIEAAAHIIHERQDVFLWWTERPSHARRMKGLPSWVPDWTSPLPMFAPKLLPYGTLPEWTYSIPNRKPLSVVADALQVQAHILDRVKTVSGIFTAENRFRLLLDEWQRLPYIEGRSMEAKVDKFWRSIVMNTGGETETFKQSAPPSKEVLLSFQSCIAEERLMQLLKCNRQQFMSDVTLRDRVRADPTMSLLVLQCGNATAFDNLFLKNALGHRFFTTENGRMGMTAYEQLPEVDQKARDEPDRPQPGFSGLTNNRMTDMLLNGFREHLAERDPRAAALVGGLLDQRERSRGVKVGDVVAAIVGGYHPYVLRPVMVNEPAEHTLYPDNSPTSTYTFVGDCYLHGVMNGECFGFKKPDGHMQWRTGVKVEDIKIV